jgi:ERCC4-type nuclease
VIAPPAFGSSGHTISDKVKKRERKSTEKLKTALNSRKIRICSTFQSFNQCNSENKFWNMHSFSRTILKSKSCLEKSESA